MGDSASQESVFSRIVQVLSYESQPSCLKKSLHNFRNEKKWRKETCERLLSTLAGCLLQPGGAEAITSYCPQLILPLLAVAKTKQEWQERGCIALGTLAQLHPDAHRFALQHLEGPKAPFDVAAVSPKPKRRRGNDTSSHVELLQASLSLLCTNQAHFSRLWHWSPLIQYLRSPDTQIKWLAFESLAMALGMSEHSRMSLENKLFTGKTRRELMLKKQSISIQFKHIWSLSEESYQEMQDVCTLCPDVASVAGIVLPAIQNSVSKGEDLVMVASTCANLRSLAVAAAAGRPVLLQGPVGCGKTALVEHLAALTGRAGPPTLLKVQLGDETDSKMLLGAYRCSDIPGEFVWQPGVLTQAVQHGSWLLLEDIDCASMDVVSVLASLIETRTLSVPGYRDCVKAATSFQLFATQRLIQGSTGLQRPHSSPSSVLDKLWLQLSVEPLARHELKTVIDTKFPTLTPVSSRLLDVFLLFSRGSHAAALEARSSSTPLTGMNENPLSQAPSLAGRLISTRDLLKWCARAVEGFEETSPDCALKVFQDAMDIFCCSAPLPEERLRLGIAVAGRLGIVSTKADYFCKEHKPTVRITPSNVSAGRATVPRLTGRAASVESNTIVFSLTRAASCLLERVASCVARSEPVLLVGETGAGKTATVQLLARRAGRQLRVINMNQHSDSADLLGGFKPVDLKLVIGPVKEEFERLFGITFNQGENAKFINHIANCFSSRRWEALMGLMQHSVKAALRKSNIKEDMKTQWNHIADRLERLETQLRAGHSSLAFSFIEGALVKAVSAGEWVLLDEINLASAETLQCLSGLLEGSAGSLHLLERGDEKPIKRNPEFRLFACMNPATDVGKKDLPPGLRNRFTELYVEELTEKTDLIQLAGCYLSGIGVPASRLESLVKLYLQLRTETTKNLASGTGHKPHYSLRTLCRALAVAATNPCGSVSRSLLEAFSLSFLTQLDRTSQQTVEQLIIKAVCGKDAKSVVKQPLPEPSHGHFIKIEGFWVQQGTEKIIVPENYILTASVRHHLRDLARAVSLGRAPVLLQGETSVGKTSLVTYLAHVTGHRCLRINNHEHTDLQEYLGQYSAGADGQLTFREGALVEAMRKGYWVILDELNLAPSDVLEALNRVLDDNRELFIPETQTLVRAHPKFMLFATQNPPGLYGGRKMLSRAFRNRFVELHFGEIPSAELETILHERCALPASYAKKMVSVMNDLQMRRRGSAAFAGKQGFMTLRDLFRWGERYRLASIENENKHNWELHLADEGYLVLAGRVRREEEAQVIQETLEKHLKCKLNPIERLFSLGSNTSDATKTILEDVMSSKVPGFEHIVWTYNMRRLAVLVGKAVQFFEPALLVGETGCGKTSVCQLLALLRGRSLLSVNCHMHTEAADFLGSLRPVRDHQDEDRLFEWMDGPLVQAMTNGDWFLADEISLADDSVLERLNSLLEPERSLLLAEKGGECSVTAQSGFQFVATMNPGGDFGKKELSPALRNRLTEVWCEGCEDRADRVAVVERSLRAGLALGNQQDGTSGVGRSAADFVEWLRKTELGARLTVSVRDLLTWVHFINAVTDDNMCIGQKKTTSLDLGSAYMHGACLTFLDSLGSGPTSGASGTVIASARKIAMKFLEKQVREQAGVSPLYSPLIDKKSQVLATKNTFGMQPFFIEKGDCLENSSVDFLFEAPSTCVSVVRLLRALQLSKPVLLEGSPGVGKTSLVHALARAAGHSLTRINLSDQTDASDLFGADLPVEGGVGGQFAWRDGPFLQALRAGHWIVLDELNLASQSVLEALNACLDHRGEVYIPELGRSFKVQAKSTRLFACQNPQRQGGARRGLPRSFLNRFTQVYIEALTPADLEFIARSSFPDLPTSLLTRMVAFTGRIAKETGELHLWGSRGGPWEMNLRDLSRWAAAAKIEANCKLGAGAAANLVYVQRMRTAEDKNKMAQAYQEEVGSEWPLPIGLPRFTITPNSFKIGGVILQRGEHCATEANNLLLLRSSLKTMHAIATCAYHSWLAILVGGPGSGKSSSVALLAALAGRTLRVLPVNSAMDTTEILGGFEQTDLSRHLDELSSQVETLVLSAATEEIVAQNDDASTKILQSWEEFRDAAADTGARTLAGETQLFQRRAKLLREVLTTLAPRPRAQYLLDLLNDITARAKAAGALNAGGRFEWVDSLLVKCLREGSWLLVENVNLCSAAVLDRLNALLEPGGSLVLGERGAAPDGALYSITPHPDFRLFFTMDPRHGDISRAMRNRGIEIYVSGPEENSCSVPSLDLRALLTSAGIYSHGEQSTLTAVHHAIRTISTGCESLPGLSTLLRAAFLSLQNKVRGTGQAEALRLACLDVYVKPRASADAKREALLELEEILSTSKLEPSLYDLLSTTATPNVSSLQQHSAFAVLQQEGTFISAVLTALAQENNTATSTFLTKICDLPMPMDEYALPDLLPALLLSFYKHSSPNDASLRHDWLTLMCHGVPTLQNTKSMSQDLYKAVLNFCPQGGLPWDPRWQGDEMSDVSLANRLSLWLEWLILSAQEQDKMSLKGHTEITVLQYSLALAQQQVSESLTSCPMITQLSQLMTAVEQSLYSIVEHPKLSSEDCEELRQGIRWCFHLKKHAATTTVTLNSAPYVASTLGVYFQWLCKKLVLPIIKTAHILNINSNVTELNALVTKIEASSDEESRTFSKLVRKALPVLGQPLPYATLQQSNARVVLDKFTSQLHLWPNSECSQWRHLVKWLISEKGQETKNILVNSLAQLNLRQDVDPVKLMQLEALQSSLTTPTIDIPGYCGGGGAWLVCEHLCLVMAARVRSLALQHSDELAHTLDHLVAMLHATPSVPPTVEAAAQALAQNLQKGTGVTASIQLLMSCVLAWQSHRSPVTHSPALWLEWSSSNMAHQEVQNTLMRELQAEKDQLNVNVGLKCPLLSLIVTTEALGSNQTLREADEKQRRQEKLAHLVWCASQALSSPLYSLNLNEFECVKASFSTFLNAIDASNKVHSFSERVSNWKSIDLPLEPLSSAASQLAALLDGLKNEKQVDLGHIGRAWVLLGYLNLALAAALPALDPVQRRAIKIKCIMKDLDESEKCVYVNELLARLMGETTKECIQSQNPHPLIDVLKTQTERLQKKHSKLANYMAVRPEPSTYPTLRKMIRQYSESVASSTMALKLCDKLWNILLSSSPSLGKANQLLTQEISWQASQQKFCEDLTGAGALYPDVAEPVLSATSQLSHGMSLLSSAVRTCIDKSKYSAETGPMLGEVCSLPCIGPNQESLCDLASTWKKISHLTGSLLPANEASVLNFKMQLSALDEIRNHIMAQGNFEEKSMSALLPLLQNLAQAWGKQEEERKRKEAEEKSIFKVKTTQEIEVEEINKTFPSFHHEFSDVLPDENMQLDSEIYQQENSPDDLNVAHITEDNLSYLATLHTEVFQNFTSAMWHKPKPHTLTPKVYGPLKERLKLLKTLLPQLLPSLDTSLDKQLAGSYLLLLCHENESENNSQPHDFYHDPLCSETAKCRPLLISVRERVSELLQQWPDHPTLVNLETVCDRLLGFPANSPVAKFLCGLELLLSQLQAWESHAHSGVSIGILSQAVSRLILDWRRLELQRWSDALNTLQCKFEKRALGKWWFYLVSLLGDETEIMDVEDLVSAIQQFMEQATLGDFVSRLTLLLAFHCQALHMPQSEYQDQLLKVLWNAHSYYSQFTGSVSSRLRSLRAPIEKKLREAVKIARWTDTNYWALRMTADKTHRTLHKHMKEFQEVLAEPANSAMAVATSVMKESNIPFEPSHFLSNLKPEGDNIGGETVSHATRWFKKAQRLSKELLLSAPYPQLVYALGELAEGVSETTKLVQSQEVASQTDDKKKKKSQMKHLLQCKRKAVADFFKSLTRLGLSYRAGIARNIDYTKESFLAAPYDLQASISQINNRVSDRDLLNAWQGSETIMSNCLARFAQLNAALEKPSSDLGPVGLDKCRGFSLHLMELAQAQRCTLASAWNHLFSLRIQLEPLCAKDEDLLPSLHFRTVHREAVDVVATTWTWLGQFSLLLASSPKSSDISEDEFITGFPSPTAQDISETSAIVNQLQTKVEAVRTTLLVIYLGPEIQLVTSATAKKLQSVGAQLDEIQNKLSPLLKVATDSASRGLIWLQEKLKDISLQLKQLPLQCAQESEIPIELSEEVERVHTQALLTLQHLYQRHVSAHSETQTEEINQEDDEEELEMNHLETKLVASLNLDIEELKLSQLNARVKALTAQLALNPAAIKLVRGCVPLLDQIVLIAQYLMTQLSATLQNSARLLFQLLSLVTLLAHKGFNMPEEVSEEESGDGPTKPAEGLGLGEGEGEKDVSDRLESEDQLEGARQAGQEKEEPADKDIQEEQGVEVSEDFEGKLQDEAPQDEDGEKEEEEKEEDDENTGQEMGETGQEAESLDKQVWGSDSEEEEEEMGEQEGGQGQDQDEAVPEVGAANAEEGPEQNEHKDWDAQEQQEFPEDQSDTQHGKAKAPEEPEALDLPDDLHLDGDEDEGGAGDEEENPFETPELSDIKELADEPEPETAGKEDEVPGENSGSEDEGDDDGGEGKQVEGEEDEEQGAEDQNQGVAQEEEMPQTTDEQDKEKDNPDEQSVKDHEAEVSAEPAPAQGSSDSTAQNETSAPQQENMTGGEAGEDKGQEGSAQMEEGHASAAKTESKLAAPANQPQGGKKEARERRKPGQADAAHTLGDINEPKQKRLRLAEGMAEEGEDEDEGDQKDEQEKGEGELHQHVKEAKNQSTQAMDAATQDQAMQQQPTVGQEEGKEVTEDESMDIVEEENEETASSTRKEVRPEKLGATGHDGKGDGDEKGFEEKVEVEGETVATMGAQRGGSCSYHTQTLTSMSAEEQQLSIEQVSELRQQLEQQLASWTQPPASAEAAQAWSQFSAATSSLARELCEQLRLVLEPTQAARLRGDYRTGRRINMRKVIPYIASEFRKDKIWLRRTRPSKRTYQVVLALDDSSSMADNHSKELAFESLSLVSQALTLLEAGELGVLSFGEEPNILHPLGDTFTEESGARLLQQLSFSQKHTRIGKLVSFATTMLTTAARQGQGSELAQLLLIVSDGRGVFSEGREVVHQAVRAAREARIFIVFLAIEDPHSKDSILDIRMPVFSGGKLQGIASYLDNFPFPFYLILRDVESLPSVLSDALRQWFELMAAAMQH